MEPGFLERNWPVVLAFALAVVFVLWAAGSPLHAEATDDPRSPATTVISHLDLMECRTVVPRMFLYCGDASAPNQ